MPWAEGRAPGLGGYEPVFFSGTGGAGDGVVLLVVAAGVGFLTLHRTPATSRVRIVRALPGVLVLLAAASWVNGYRAAGAEVDAWVRRGGSGGLSIGLWLAALGIVLMAVGTVVLLPEVVRWKTAPDDPSDEMHVTLGAVARVVGGIAGTFIGGAIGIGFTLGLTATPLIGLIALGAVFGGLRRRLWRRLAGGGGGGPGATAEQLRIARPRTGPGAGRRYHGPPCRGIGTSSPARSRRSSRRPCSAPWGPSPGSPPRSGVEGVAFTSWRATLGVTFLVILIVARRGVGSSLRAIQRLDGRGRAALAIAALMGLLLNAAVFTAFERIPIALALMLFYTYPAGVVVADAALGRETITPTRLLALLLSTTGVVLVLAGGMDGNGGAPIDPVGVLLALVAAAAQVVFITISRNGYRSVPTETATLVIIGTSMVGGALLAVAVGQGDSLVAPLRSLAPWPAVLFAGVAAAGLSSLLFLTAIRQIGGTRTGILMLFEPVTGRDPRGAAARRSPWRRSRCSARRSCSRVRWCCSSARRPSATRSSRPGRVPSSRRPGRRPGAAPARGRRQRAAARSASHSTRVDRVLDVALLVALDPDRPVHDERPHEAHPGLLHHAPRAGVDGHRGGVDAPRAELGERLVDQRDRPLGGVAAAPRRPDQAVPELGLVVRVLGERPQVEPAEERAGRALDRRPEAVAVAAVVVGQPERQVVVAHLVAGRRRAAGDVAHDRRIAVEGDEVVEVVGGEPAQDQALGLEVDDGDVTARPAPGARPSAYCSLISSGPSPTSIVDPPVHDLDRVHGEGQLGRRVEGLAVGQVEPRQVERAGQRAGGQEPAVELEVLVRAGALEGVELAVDVDDEDGVRRVDPDHPHLALGELVDAEQVDPAAHAVPRLRRRRQAAAPPDRDPAARPSAHLASSAAAQPVLGVLERDPRRRPARGTPAR